MKKLLVLALTVLLLCTTNAAAADMEVTPNEVYIEMGGSTATLTAYNIDGYNYFMLRDLAYTLADTDRAFDVAYDDELKAINLVSDTRYSGEQNNVQASDVLEITPTNDPIFSNGEQVSLDAYNINGYNYFKLRDICDIFGITVDYDNDKGIIMLGAKKTYESSNSGASSSADMAINVDEWLGEYKTVDADGTICTISFTEYSGDQNTVVFWFAEKYENIKGEPSQWVQFGPYVTGIWQFNGGYEFEIKTTSGPDNETKQTFRLEGDTLYMNKRTEEYHYGDSYSDVIDTKVLSDFERVYTRVK